MNFIKLILVLISLALLRYLNAAVRAKQKSREILRIPKVKNHHADAH